jgi:osomolarity two-component system sensor histidine kinase SLN1
MEDLTSFSQLMLFSVIHATADDVYPLNPRANSKPRSASSDIQSALAGGGLSALLQVVVFARNQTRNDTRNDTRLFNATTSTGGIEIPGVFHPNGSQVFLGDDGLGFPPALYPNISYSEIPGTPDPADSSNNLTLVSAFADFPLNQTAVLVLGPFQINSSYALLSMTLPITDDRNPAVVLGYMTVVASCTSLIDVVNSREGLAKTGVALLIGTRRRENQFAYQARPATATKEPKPADLGAAVVKYVFPPNATQGRDRHTAYLANLTRYGTSNFSAKEYPAAVAGFGIWNNQVNQAGHMLSTKNENNVSVSVGYARPQSSLVDWLLVVEMTHKEAWEPVQKLRLIVLACVFGSIGLILLVVIPTAHFSVRPIRRLRDATEKSIAPPGYTPNGSIRSERLDDDLSSGEPGLDRTNSTRSKMGLFLRLRHLTGTGKKKTTSQRSEEDRRRVFKIPARVQDRKHFITDELTELTGWYSINIH